MNEQNLGCNPTKLLFLHESVFVPVSAAVQPGPGRLSLKTAVLGESATKQGRRLKYNQCPRPRETACWPTEPQYLMVWLSSCCSSSSNQDDVTITISLPQMQFVCFIRNGCRSQATRSPVAIGWRLHRHIHCRRYIAKLPRAPTRPDSSNLHFGLVADRSLLRIGVAVFVFAAFALFSGE